MITRVTLKNFKLHASTEIEAAPITVFIGPNNSGKSSIFQALLSLRQAASIGGNLLYPPGRHPHLEGMLIVDIGEYEDVLRHGEQKIELTVEGELSVREPYNVGKPLGVSFALIIRENRPAYYRGSLNIRGLRAGDLLIPPQEFRWEWGLSTEGKQIRLSTDKADLDFSTNGSFRLIDGGGVTPRRRLSPDELVDIRGLHEYLENAAVNLLNSLHPVMPIRGFEAWAYPLPDDRSPNIDRLALPDRAIALASNLAYDREQERKLSEWLKEVLQIGIEFRLIPPKRVTIRTRHSPETNSGGLFLNEGSGASQLPFILIPVGLASENETILLCEPEAHFHPEAQSKLMRFLLKIARDRKLQYFIETHSEHILHALLHAVAKGDLAKSDLAIYYFENVQGEAKVRRLEVNEQGQVEGGLPGFFDQSLKELTEYLEALKKS